MRLNKFIAGNSQYSRRKADELIASGKVKLNGQLINTLGSVIDPEKDRVEVEGKLISDNEEKIYLALYKPAGYVSTRSDELNRQTIMDLVPKIPNLKPVGRLDKDTEGLILLSNDGNFINRYTHPKFNCEKTYFAEIRGELTILEKEKLERGVPVDGRKTAPAKIFIIKSTENQTLLRMTIHEGRNRQIRKMFDYINHPVKYLQRLSIGKIKLGLLKRGAFRKLTKSEINAN